MERKILTQPAAVAYAISELNLFTQYSRETYHERFGVDAPDYNPGYAPKSWFTDDVVVEDVFNYNYFNPKTGAIEPTSIPGSQAKSINLPGAKTYPKYTPQPNGAYAGSIGNSINSLEMCLPEQARTLATEFGLNPDDVIEGSFAGFPVTYPAGENRRYFGIVFKTVFVVLGMKLADEYANGIGAPGAWNLDGAEPVWMAAPAPTVPKPNLDPVPVPVRSLYSNEKIQRSGPALDWQVAKVAPAPAPTPQVGIEVRIGRLEADMIKIKRSVGIN